MMLCTFYLLPVLLMLIEGAPFDHFLPGGPGRNILDNDYFFGNGAPPVPFPGNFRGPRTPQRPPQPFVDNDYFFGNGPPALPFPENPRGPRRPQRPPQSFGEQEFPDDTDDLFVFDRPTTPRPQPIQSTTRRTTTTSRTSAPSSDVTTSGPASTIANCNCPSTPEFNPVCGTDASTYSNPGKLQCAVTCGADVSIKHFGNCIPTSTAAPRTTRRN